MKWWWSEELAGSCKEVLKLEWQAYKRRVHPQDPIHRVHKARRNAYSSMIECAKKAHWEGFLSFLDDKTVWVAHRYMSGEPTDGGKTRVPTLKVKQVNGQVQNVETNTDKSEVLKDTFFLGPVTDVAQHTEADYADPKFKYEPITNTQI